MSASTTTSTSTMIPTWMSTSETEDEMRSKTIDWNAPFIDPDTIIQEPPPPPNKSIYALTTTPGYRIQLSPPNPQWPSQFQSIKSHIHDLLTTSTPPILYKTIEHIGSTSIPDLIAKPNIDVLVTFTSKPDLDAATEAFNWEIPLSPPYTRYTVVPNGGGIQGRTSLKLYIDPSSPYSTLIPERSVYLICDAVENHAGRVQIRCYRDVVRVLSDPVNRDLLDEYAGLKVELAGRVYEDSITYSGLKDGVVRRILERAGWTGEEVDEKERLSFRRVEVDELPY